MSLKDKCGFGFDIRKSTRLEYERHVHHQAKFLKGTWDLVYKDECEPARDYGQELSLMTQTSTQRHMHEQVSKGANKKETKKDGTKQAQKRLSMLSQKGES